MNKGRGPINGPLSAVTGCLMPYEQRPSIGVPAGITPLGKIAIQSAFTTEIVVPGTYTTNPPLALVTQ